VVLFAVQLLTEMGRLNPCSPTARDQGHPAEMAHLNRWLLRRIGLGQWGTLRILSHVLKVQGHGVPSSCYGAGDFGASVVAKKVTPLQSF